MPGTIHRLKIELRDIEPPIWRRVEAPSTTTLARLHDVIQIAIGWEDCHLHEFTIGDERYGVDDGEDDEPPEDERRARLDRVAPAGTAIEYLYDFGDSWEVDITVESVTDADPDATYPRCVDGARAGPPEDCGGAFGFQRLLDALANPGDEEHDELREWAGDFDPDRFDVDRINAQLAKLASRRRGFV